MAVHQVMSLSRLSVTFQSTRLGEKTPKDMSGQKGNGCWLPLNLIAGNGSCNGILYLVMENGMI